MRKFFLGLAILTIMLAIPTVFYSVTTDGSPPNELTQLEKQTAMAAPMVSVVSQEIQIQKQIQLDSGILDLDSSAEYIIPLQSRQEALSGYISYLYLNNGYKPDNIQPNANTDTNIHYSWYNTKDAEYQQLQTHNSLRS